MTLRKLIAFVAVCKHMNMAAAARELFISPPAVSKIISELEEYYDTSLFSRVGKNIYLTDAGRELYSFSVSILESIDKMDAKMKLFSNSPVIRLGTTLTYSAIFLPSLLTDYQNTINNARIVFTALRAHTIEQQIFTGELDFGIYAGESIMNTTEAVPLFEDELVFICSRTHPLMRDIREDEEGLVLIPKADTHLDLFLREKNSSSFSLVDSVLCRSNIDYSVRGTLNNIDGIVLCTSKGLGIGVVSKSSHLPEDVCFFRIKGIAIKRMYYLVYSKKRELPPAFTEFIDFVCRYKI